MRADEVRRGRHGTIATFVRVAEVPAAPGEPISVPSGAGEVRIIGVPATLADAVRRVTEVRAVVSATPLSAYSLSDLEELAARDGVTLRALLEELQAAGLVLVGEAVFDRLQDPRRAIEQVNIAGLALARLTVDWAAAVDELALFKSVAALQHRIAVVRAFAPLSRRINPAMPSTGAQDVKRVALARLIVDTVPSIQIDWRRYGPKLAQVALTMGADDLDGVSAEDDTSLGPRRSPLEEVRRNIQAAGFEPVERNALFEMRR